MTARVLSLCSGYGGLDLAVEAVFDAVTIAHAEYEAAPSRVLAARWPDIPNLGDLTAIDWATVDADIFTAGYPCQPFSLGGRRKGTADARHLWPHIAEGIRRVRPRLVVLENVSGHRSLGFDTVLGNLAALGYVGSWTSLRAADIGAPHGRERVFILAADTHCMVGAKGGALNRRPGQMDEPGTVERAVGLHRLDHRRCCHRGHRDAVDQHPIAFCDGRHHCVAADTDDDPARTGRSGRYTTGSGSEPAQHGRDAVAHTDRHGREGVGRVDALGRDADGRRGADIAWGAYEPAVRRWEQVLGRVAPSPTAPGPKGGQRLSPRFVEWMMGLPDGWVTDVPGLTRNEQLKMLGNGVVPQQAIAALRWLTQVASVAA